MAFGGCTNGYVTARFLKFFGQTDLVFTTLICAVALPLYIISALLIESAFAWYGELPAKNSFGKSILRAIGLYLLHATLCYYGAFAGYA